MAGTVTRPGPPAGTVRLFVGAPVPPSTAYAQVTEALQRAVEGVKPVPAGSWHVTLRFLGDVEGAQPVVEALDTALQDMVALPVEIRGVGAFQDARRARIAWAGVQAPGLEQVARRVQEATKGLGQEEAKRSFRPHVTLARLRKPADVSDWIRRHERTRLAQGRLDHVVLYRSHLGPHGPRYERLHQVRLKD